MSNYATNGDEGIGLLGETSPGGEFDVMATSSSASSAAEATAIRRASDALKGPDNTTDTGADGTAEGEPTEPEMPSAPEVDELAVMPQENVRFLRPEMQSFDDFPKKRETWIRAADADGDFLTMIRENKEFVESNKEWLWRPNATAEDDLLKAANNDDDAKKYKNNATWGTRVNPGEILFCRNRNQQMVYGQGMHMFTFSITKIEGEPVNLYAEEFIQRDIITIVNLQPNQIAVALYQNEPVVLLPGRHCYNDPDFILKADDIFTMKNMGPTIQKHTVLIVRIGDFECGLGYNAGNPVLLQPGLHVSISPSFQFVKSIDTREFQSSKKKDQITAQTHDNISIVQVPQSMYGTGFLSGEPVLMLPGLHMYNNASFNNVGSVHQAKPHIVFDNLHIIQIQPEQIGLAWEGAEPFLLGPGVWKKNSPLFRFDGFRRADERKIEHGSITRFVVENGELGFAWQDGLVCEVPPGIGVKNNPNFKFITNYKLSNPVIQFGNIAHVTTREGHKRPVFVDGKLLVLGAGYRKFEQPNLLVGDAFPTGEIIKPITTHEVLTRDRTPMLVTGQVTYQIQNANDLILNLGYAKLESYIEHTLSAILRHAFSITDLSTISPDANQESVANEGYADEQSDKAPMPLFKRDAEDAEGQNFRSELCTEIHKELARVTKKWGIGVHDVAISDVQFKDQEVADKLAAATSNTRTAEAEFDLTLAQSKIRLEKAQVDAKEKLILQKNDTQIERIDTEAKSSLRLIDERTNAEAHMIRKGNEAAAEAQSIKQLAIAKKDAALLEAEGAKAMAEAQIAQYSNPACLQLRMMELWVQGAQALSKAPTPTVLLQNNGEGGDGNGLLDIFRKQGKHLLGSAGVYVNNDFHREKTEANGPADDQSGPSGDNNDNRQQQQQDFDGSAATAATAPILPTPKLQKLPDMSMAPKAPVLGSNSLHKYDNARHQQATRAS